MLGFKIILLTCFFIVWTKASRNSLQTIKDPRINQTLGNVKHRALRNLRKLKQLEP
jgi:hypothetical protein